MYDTDQRELTEVEQAVYLTYLQLSECPQDWIRIARIHEHLDYHPDDISDAIVSLVHNGDAHIAPESNTKVLTAEDHAAAIREGSEACHLILFED
jgi:hypothetical protein